MRAPRAHFPEGAAHAPGRVAKAGLVRLLKEDTCGLLVHVGILCPLRERIREADYQLFNKPSPTAPSSPSPAYRLTGDAHGLTPSGRVPIAGAVVQASFLMPVMSDENGGFRVEGLHLQRHFPQGAQAWLRTRRTSRRNPGATRTWILSSSASRLTLSGVRGSLNLPRPVPVLIPGVRVKRRPGGIRCRWQAVAH